MEPLERIYHQYRDFVYRICARYARDPDDAEDMTQETFIKISGRLASFRGESEMSTWLYRVAVNCCLDHLRRRRRDDRLRQDYLDGMVIRNLAPDGDRILAALVLDRILDKLRPLLRRILFMTLAEGLSYAEAATVLGISTAAVSKSVSRFLKKGPATPIPAANGAEGAPARRVSGNPGPDASKSEAREKTHG